MGNLVWQIGDITVTRLVEMAFPVALGGMLPDADAATIDSMPWLRPHFVNEDGLGLLSIHALLVQTPTMRLVVDTCVGNDKIRSNPGFSGLQTNFLRDLEAAGWARDSVDGVLCTHLHIDHVGWNTMWEGGRWVPTFPKARYYMGRTEYEHWRAETAGEANAADPLESRATFDDSVKPVVDAGLHELVETDTMIAPGVRLMPTPGHTPGHVSVVLESRGERAIITGDMMHHPCQIGQPHWAMSLDDNRELATSTRKAFVSAFADTPTLVIGTHFGGPTAGRLRAGDAGYWLDVHVDADVPQREEARSA